jgi:alkylhydroperoxidase/carboxymuconolactone decarboxylase family protein YurZ
MREALRAGASVEETAEVFEPAAVLGTQSATSACRSWMRRPAHLFGTSLTLMNFYGIPFEHLPL